MPTHLHRYDDAHPFTATDGSEIRELLHPRRHGNQAMSLAEATLYSGQKTRLHRHPKTEEIYHVTAGQGTMIFDGERFFIGVGDTIHIPPGTPHALENTWPVPLRVLCCCQPAYSDADTELLD